MKKIFIAVSAIGLFLASCNSADQYKLTGKVAGMTEGKVYLSKPQDSKLVKIDSTVIGENGFSFEGTVESPEMYYIELEGQKGAIQLFLENSVISVDANLENLREAKVVGSTNQDIMLAFGESQKDVQEKQQSMYQEYQKAMQAKNQTAADSIRGEFDKSEEVKTAANMEFVKANANTVAAGFIAQRMSGQMEIKEMEDLYNLLGEAAKESSYGVKINEKINTMKKVAVGQPAPDFTIDTPEGTPLSLSSFKGKVVLVDVWASWCGPCRRANPEMVELYNEVHDRGVEFLGVSLDRDREAWLKAIEDDKLTWHHVSELKYWDSKVVKSYAVSGVPFTLLVDQNGNIAGTKLHGEELKAAIEKLLQ